MGRFNQQKLFSGLRARPAAGTLSVEPSEELNVSAPPLFSALDRVEPIQYGGDVSTGPISSVTSEISWEEEEDPPTVATESVPSVSRIRTARDLISSAVTSGVTTGAALRMSVEEETNDVHTYDQNSLIKSSIYQN